MNTFPIGCNQKINLSEEQINIILRLYFPFFTQKENSSRFEKFFIKLSKKNKKAQDKNANIDNKLFSFNINPSKIIQGLDKRTSIILKNIPNCLNRVNFRNFIETFGNINYFYIRQDKNNKFLSLAFINFVNHRSIVNIYMYIRKNRYQYFSKLGDISIFYSKIQGKENLLKFLVNFQ